MIEYYWFRDKRWVGPLVDVTLRDFEAKYLTIYNSNYFKIMKTNVCSLYFMVIEK